MSESVAYTRFDIWTEDGKTGSSALAVTEDGYNDFLVINVEWGGYRKANVSTWRTRDIKWGGVTEYTLVWFYANERDVQADNIQGIDNGYRAGETVAMAYLKARELCDCCEHDADNDAIV